MWKSCGQHPYWWSALLLFITLAPFKYVYTGNLSLRLKNVTHLRTSVLATEDKKKYCEFAVCTTHPFCHLPTLCWIFTLCTCAWLFACACVCVAQGHVVKTPAVPPSHLPHTICQFFLLSNVEGTHYTFTHKRTLTHSSEANMTKVDSRKATWWFSEVLQGIMMKHVATSCHTAMQNRVAKVASWCRRRCN